MKFLALLFIPIATYSQTTCQGFIIEKGTGHKIPYANIGLVKQNTGVNADAHGRFSITSLLKGDSLRISCVGYEPQTYPAVDWKNGSMAALQPKSGSLREVIVAVNTDKKPYTLNRFAHCSWNWFQIELHTIYQLAQRFDAPKTGMQLQNLELCKDPAESIFRIHVYDIDSACQCPSSDLADTIIEVRSKESHVRIDLEDYVVTIPGKTFFVAVEWLFIPFNERREKEKRSGRRVTATYYNPAIRFVESRNTKPGNSWQLGFNGSWAQESFYRDDNYQITVTLK